MAFRRRTGRGSSSAFDMGQVFLVAAWAFLVAALGVWVPAADVAAAQGATLGRREQRPRERHYWLTTIKSSAGTSMSRRWVSRWWPLEYQPHRQNTVWCAGQPA